MIIGSIRDGVVIDHIPAGRGMQIYHYLKLDEVNCEVAIIKNAESKKHQKKDILKISEVLELDYNILSCFAPDITVNIIRGGKLVQKIHPTLPEKISGVLRCANPRCITSVEQELEHVFRLADRNAGTYRCIYCDTIAKRS